MDTPQIQTSFIPKQTLVKQVSKSPRVSMGLFTILAFLILGISVVAAGAAYAYYFTLKQEINAPCSNPSLDVTTGCGLIATLQKQRERFDPNHLTQLRRLSAKIQLANQVLNNHATLVPLFALLNESTLKTVQYRRFVFDQQGVTIDGVALAYEDIAVQSKEFAKSQNGKAIKSFIFSDLNTTEDGKVSFKLQMTIDPAFLSYRAYVTSRPAGFETLPATPSAPDVPKASSTPYNF